MFLQLSVSHSVHRGLCLPQCMLGYTHCPPRQKPPQANAPPCPVHAGIDMATAADGTHPNGMHSCFMRKFVRCCIWNFINV